MGKLWGVVVGAALTALGCDSNEGSSSAKAAVAEAVVAPGALVMGAIEAKVATDSVAQYDMVKRNNGSAVDLCVHAGLVSAAYLQAKNEPEFKKWKGVEKSDCASAGMPQ